MNKPMTREEKELLVCLAEECAEVIQATTKCLRFGKDHFWKAQGKTNIEHLQIEIGDVSALVYRLVKSGFLEDKLIRKAGTEKDKHLDKNLKCKS